MIRYKKPAAVLWTGGKDSALAFYEAQLAGYEIVKLVTFVPDSAQFRAHPLRIMEMQSEAIGIPHTNMEMKQPFKDSYVKAIRDLKENCGIDVLITGDIAEVDGYPNWIRECSEPCCAEIFTPLWHSDRTEVLKRLIANKFTVIFTCVKKPWFSSDWIGKSLDTVTLDQLQRMNSGTGLDVCGERGEYHTMVLDGPFFKKQINITSYSYRCEESLIYIDIHGTGLYSKSSH